MTERNYDALRDYLKTRTEVEFVMTPEQIEDILDFGLPRAAQRAEWWFDDSPWHPKVQRQATRDGGYDTHRLPDGTIRFRKSSAPKYRPR
jgi:hypothetical protein